MCRTPAAFTVSRQYRDSTCGRIRVADLVAHDILPEPYAAPRPGVRRPAAPSRPSAPTRADRAAAASDATWPTSGRSPRPGRPRSPGCSRSTAFAVEVDVGPAQPGDLAAPQTRTAPTPRHGRVRSSAIAASSAPTSAAFPLVADPRATDPGLEGGLLDARVVMCAGGDLLAASTAFQRPSPANDVRTSLWLRIAGSARGELAQPPRHLTHSCATARHSTLHGGGPIAIFGGRAIAADGAGAERVRAAPPCIPVTATHPDER